MTGDCLCGAVEIELEASPLYLNACNCTLCSKSGAVWAYCAPREARVSGRTRQFRRKDRDIPGVDLHFCDACGVTTHWTLTEEFIRSVGHGNAMGVNACLFEPADLAGVELRFPDGRAWPGKGDYKYRRPHEVLGERGLSGSSWPAR